MSFSKRLGRNTPQFYTKPLDSLKNWNNRFFWVDERVFPTVVDWRTNAPKDGMPAEGTYSLEAVRVLDTHRTPIQKQPEMLLCLVGISRRYYLGDELYPTFLHDDDWDIDFFNLIRAPNPVKVKTGSRPRAPHEVPLLTLTAPRVIEIDEPVATDSSGVLSTIERSSLDFAHEAGPRTREPRLQKCHRSRTGLPWGKSLAAIQLGLASTVFVPEDAPVGVSDPDPLSFADAPSHHPVDVAQSSPGIAAAGDPESENASSPAEVAMGSQLRLRFEQEAKLMRKFVAQVARRDKRIQARELEIRNLEASLEAEANAKRAAEDKSDGLSQELESMRPQFSGLQVSNERLSQQVATLQQQDERVEQRCEEMDARLDALSIDFDEELYPHMLTAIAGRRWVIGRGLRLAVMKCGESLELRQAFADAVFVGIAKGLSEGLRHGLEHGIKRLEVSISGSTGRPEGRADGCDHGCSVRDPQNPWACKEEIGLANAITANISRAEKKRKCRIVCRTHGVGSAHHTRSNGVPVSAPTVVPQGLAILLANVATQTESDDT
nr:hypothetical protein [Tanacetum cinerariifolium]